MIGLKFKQATLSFLGCFACAALTASATAINITVNSSGVLYSGGVANSTEYIPSANSPSDNLSFLKTEIGSWNASHDTPTLADVSPSLTRDLVFSELEVEGSHYTPTASGHYEYVVLHFGAGPAGSQGVSPGGYWEAVYLGGVNIDTLTFSLPTVGGKDVGGFSSAVFFDQVSSPVPDGGLTLAMLGMGISGLALMRWKL